MGHVKFLLEGWVFREQIATLWLVIVAILFFGMVLTRSRSDDERAWTWVRRLLEALSQSIVLIVIIGLCHFLISNNRAIFNDAHGSFLIGGSLSNQAWEEDNHHYGGHHVQEDLIVTQYVMLETEEIIQPQNPSAKPLYRKISIEQPIEQNSIVSFRGEVNVFLENARNQLDTYNTYTLSAKYIYEILNPTETQTRVEFRFPLSQQTKLYQDIIIKEDGKEIPFWFVEFNQIAWETRLEPGECNKISIRFTSRGMDRYTFRFLEPREIIDFKLELTTNSSKIYQSTYPENGGVQLDYREINQDSILTWTIDHSVMAPSLGIVFVQGWLYAPNYALVTILPYAARASLFFLALAILTSIIFNKPFSLKQLALFAGLYTIPFLLLMVGGVPANTSISQAELVNLQIKLLPVVSILSLALAFIALRKQPRYLSTIILIIMALFIIGYPCIGLIPDERKQNAIEGGIQVAMLAYIFALTLFSRIRHISKRKKLL